MLPALSKKRCAGCRIRRRALRLHQQRLWRKAEGGWAKPWPRGLAGAGVARKRFRILLADDNADMREYVQRLLGEHYDVTAVADGQAAWQAAQGACPTWS